MHTEHIALKLKRLMRLFAIIYTCVLDIYLRSIKQAMPKSTAGAKLVLRQ